MDQRILYLGIGLFIGWWYFQRRQAVSGSIEIGDKGKDVADLQLNISKLTGQAVVGDDPGVYDKKTGRAVKQFFEGTRALRDPESGRLDKSFLKDFNIAINRL